MNSTKTALGDTALFKVTLVVAQREFHVSQGVVDGALRDNYNWSTTAGEWLMNLLNGVSVGQDMSSGAMEFLSSIIAMQEVELDLVEKTESCE